VLEATVLDGLREHLMHPCLVAEFMAEYAREWTRLRKETRRAGLEAELRTVERQIRNIIEAVKAGFVAPAMEKEMAALETRHAELRTRVGNAPAGHRWRCIPGLAGDGKTRPPDLPARGVRRRWLRGRTTNFICSLLRTNLCG
jgi:hypothetical protein